MHLVSDLPCGAEVGALPPAVLETIRTRLDQLCDPNADLIVCPEARRLCLQYASVADRQRSLIEESETEQRCANPHCLKCLPPVSDDSYKKQDRRKVSPGTFPPETPVGAALAAVVVASRSFFMCNACFMWANGDQRRGRGRPVGEWRVPRRRVA